MRFERERRNPADESPKGEHWRTRVEFDDQFGVTIVADERLTSGGIRAQVLEATTHEHTEDSVRWLHSTLGELVAAWDARLKAAGGKPRRTAAPSVPQNDVDLLDHLKVVSRIARDLHEIAMEDGTSPEDLMDAMQPLGEALSRLRNVEAKLSPVRAVAVGDDVAEDEP